MGVGAPTWAAAALQWTAQAGLVAEATATFAAQSGLITGNWAGLGSGKYAGAAAPFAAWLGQMQTQSIINATTCWQALGSYLSAFGTMVPLPLIIANRVAARTAQVACFLGAPNTEAVRLELEYAVMWAHNATVMTGYDVAVNTATAFKPVPPPPPLTSLGGAADMAGSAAQAAARSAASPGKSASTARHSSAASSAAQAPQQMLSQGMGMGQQMMNPMMSPPGAGTAGQWGNLLGGGSGLGSFGGAGSTGGSGNTGGAGGVGAAGALMPSSAPLAEMTRPAPVAAAAPPGFGGVPNAATATRPAMPMVPPMHPPMGGKRSVSEALSSGPVITAAEQEFPAAVIPAQNQAESDAAQTRSIAV